jgi:hypothetical protein
MGTAGAITGPGLSLVTASGSEIGLAPEHDGAISSTATCAANANRVASLDAPVTLDSLPDGANGTSWDRLLPWLLATPGLRGSLGSLIPQTSPSFDFVSDLSSIQLPFHFTTTSVGHTRTAASDSQLGSSRPYLDAASGLDRATSLPDECRSPFKSFFFSPSASTSSLASSSPWASERPSREESAAMPGQIVEMRAGAPAPLPVPEEYFTRPSTCAVADTTNETQWRPHSSGRPASPIFARWVRRHHHYHSQRHNSGQLQPRTSTESKVSGSSSAVAKQSPARSRSSSFQKRQSHMGGVPQMTREEFEALPLAIQRKVCLFFSTSCFVSSCWSFRESTCLSPRVHVEHAVASFLAARNRPKTAASPTQTLTRPVIGSSRVAVFAPKIPLHTACTLACPIGACFLVVFPRFAPERAPSCIWLGH